MVLSTWAMSTKLASDDGGGGYFMIILHASIQTKYRREKREKLGFEVT